MSKFSWELETDRKGLWLRTGVDNLRDEDLEKVQAWTEEHKCGTRMSYNQWRFKNEMEITFFLMVWQ